MHICAPIVTYTVHLLGTGCYMVSNENEVSLEDMPVVRDFPDVFPDDLLDLPPEREVEFTID